MINTIFTITFGIFACFIIYLIKRLNKLNFALKIMSDQLKHDTAFILYIGEKLNLKDSDYDEAVNKFDEMIRVFNEIEDDEDF